MSRTSGFHCGTPPFTDMFVVAVVTKTPIIADIVTVIGSAMAMAGMALFFFFSKRAQSAYRSPAPPIITVNPGEILEQS